MNTDKLNQIEGYAGLDRWCDNNFIDQSDTVVLECYPAEETEQKLLEMQEEIERLRAELNKLKQAVNSKLYDFTPRHTVIQELLEIASPLTPPEGK